MSATLRKVPVQNSNQQTDDRHDAKLWHFTTLRNKATISFTIAFCSSYITLLHDLYQLYRAKEGDVVFISPIFPFEKVVRAQLDLPKARRGRSICLHRDIWTIANCYCIGLCIISHIRC